MQRIARRLLAEGRAANYDEAEVAASLLALKFGDVEALQAAKECSSVESALAFLQQECELCTGRFAMSQVSVVTFGRMDDCSSEMKNLENAARNYSAHSERGEARALVKARKRWLFSTDNVPYLRAVDSISSRDGKKISLPGDPAT